MKEKQYFLKKRVQSFCYAFAGIKTLLREEPNARIHTVALCVVIVCGCWLQLQKGEWVVIVICAGGVIAAEAFNAAVENLADVISAEKNKYIKNAKDLAAAAVLISAAAAAAAGLLIFVPHVVTYFNS